MFKLLVLRQDFIACSLDLPFFLLALLRLNIKCMCLTTKHSCTVKHRLSRLVGTLVNSLDIRESG